MWLPDFKVGSDKQRQWATDLRNVFIRSRWGTVAAVPEEAQQVLLRATDARWWINNRTRLDALFDVPAGSSNSTPRVASPTGPPRSMRLPSDARNIYSSTDGGMYSIQGKMASWYRDCLRRGLVLRQSLGKDDFGDTMYTRVIKYRPPRDSGDRFAVFACEDEISDLLDFTREKDAVAHYEWMMRITERPYETTDVPGVQHIPHTRFTPCHGSKVPW